jgi:transcriptional regulator with XRE-family HTH domain
MPKINKERDHPLDIAIGQTVRLRRRELGLTQVALGEVVGVSFQQVQKYERGSNRISFSRLVEISRALGCTISDLTHGLDTDENNSRVLDLSKMSSKGADDLLCAYQNIPVAHHRRAVLELARRLAGEAVSG